MIESLRSAAEVECGCAARRDELCGRSSGGVLWLGFVGNFGVGSFLAREMYFRESLPSGVEALRVDEIFQCVGVAFVGEHRGGAEGFAAYGVDAPEGELLGTNAQQRVRCYEVEQAFAGGVAVGSHVGRHGDAVEFALGELGLDVECADRLDFIAEEVDAVGEFRRITEYVDYRSADGEVARFVYIVHLAESVGEKPFAGVVEVDFLACGQPERMGRQVGLAGHLLGDGLGVGDYGTQRLVGGVAQAVERLDAHNLRWRVDPAVFNIAFVGRW